MKCAFLIFFIYFLGSINAEYTEPIVSTPLGKVEGYHRNSTNGKTFFSFEGVPYAKPPIGKRRFKAPQPIKPWVGVWKAKNIYKCLQYFHSPNGEKNVLGEEDCLYLNIYTPSLKSTAYLDVIVYLHGGAFMFNYGAKEGPEKLLNHEVVYVNFNYRLGPLGFLSTEDDNILSNIGMRDQIAALTWIKQNIIYFGGNPNSITLIGGSAGGASVHFHYFSPKSKGLFQRGISQSGTMLNPWVLMEKPVDATIKLAEIVGCEGHTAKAIIQCLRSRPGKEIVSAVQHFQKWLYNPFSPWGVVVDHWSADPVLPEHPYKMLINKKVADLPWISSRTTGEGLYPAAEFYPEKNLNELELHWNEYLPAILHYEQTVKPNDLNVVTQKIREKYLNGTTLTRATYPQLVEICGDRLFVIDIEKATQLQAAATNAPVFHYVFDYRGFNSDSEKYSGTNENIGVSHSDDTNFIFKTSLDTMSTSEDREMSKLLVDMVYNFAHTGVPAFPGIKWPGVPKNAEHISYLRIKSPKNLMVENKTETEERKFWDSLPFRENEKLLAMVKDEL